MENNMKRIIQLALLGSLLISSMFVQANCFIARDKKGIISVEGDCSKRHPPCSTFKIPISLMGFNEGILIDATHPMYDFKPGYADTLEVWKQPHNPSLWIKNSCIWYSRIITRKIGMARFKRYVEQFDYGNMDVSGDRGKYNGLSSSWLSSSLKISPKEQIHFLGKLLNGKLPVSPKAQELTRSILYMNTLANGWKLYGKTGSGTLVNADGTKDEDHQIGWFVGWLEKQDQTIVFAYFIEDKEKMETFAGPRAKEEALQKIMSIKFEV